MYQDRVLPLFGPGPLVSRPLKGLYRDQVLPDRGRAGPWIYANFVQTLDGRISLIDAQTGIEGVAGSIADPRDWRLFQELASHADVLLSSGRYLRDLRAGTAQDILPLGSDTDFLDLHAARRDRGQALQPDVLVISASLDFVVPQLLLEQGRTIHVLTTADADSERLHRRKDEGARVHQLGTGERVSGTAIASILSGLGYRRAYCATGPWVFHTLAADGVLDTLFLTTRHRLVAGNGGSFIAGATLEPPADLKLETLFLDQGAAVGQLYARYQVLAPPGS
ncbi:dihydrofolate reductase family protein [Methylonatrum kenyense]|uniref:RibD family protein n=1 Tax=Methylonatrum kenyense TaxID=455253 RepID=UPI0020C0F77D|nr:dihydrofolate reductase family protein [Methylonatrum kenyense]MCK8515795.1 dihydrofolate reductase family protein [Methylonatrum kenyense]